MNTVLIIAVSLLILVTIYQSLQLKSLSDKWDEFKAAFAKIGVII